MLQEGEFIRRQRTRVQPFKYSADADSDTVELTAPTMVFNHGTIFSQPILTVYGSGDITLTINGEDFTLTGVEESITIDSEIRTVAERRL